MTARFADALQECLERIETGTPAPEAMALHPELRGELEPRLRAALAVRAKRTPMPTAPRAALRSRLTTLDETDGPGDRWPFPRRVEWRRTALLAAGVLAALVLVLGGLHVVSASSRPGDALYPVRMGFERLRGAVLDNSGEADPGLGTREDAADADARPTPSPTASAVVRQSAARGTPTVRLDAAPSARVTDEAGPRALGRVIESKPSVTIPASPAATATLTLGVVPAATEDLGASSPTTGTELPTPVPATASPAPTESLQVSTGAIEGTVFGTEGQPLDGASVIVQTVHAAMQDRAGPDQLKATTDSAGRYRIDGVPIGTHLVFVRVGSRIVWYPGKQDRKDADEVAVNLGQTTTGVDIRMDQLGRGSRGRQRGAAPP